MKLSAGLLNTIKFLIMIAAFSLILFLIFSVERRILEGFKTSHLITVEKLKVAQQRIVFAYDKPV